MSIQEASGMGKPNTKPPRSATSENEAPNGYAAEGENGFEFNRPPRYQPDLPMDEIEVPGPPDIDPPENQGFSLAQILPMLIPILPILLYALASLTLSTATGSSSSLFVLVRLVAPLVTLLITIALGGRALNQWEKLRKEREEEKKRQTRQNYVQRVRQVHEVLIERYAEQLGILNRIHPPVEELKQRLPVLENKLLRFPDKRLWERRSSDPDFLSVRVGKSIIPSYIKVTYPNLFDFTLPRDQKDALYEAIGIGQRYQYLEKAPLLVNLRDRGAIAVVGSENNALDTMRALIMQVAVHHAPNDVALYVIAPEDGKRQPSDMRWHWARWLPHCNANLVSSSEFGGTGDWVARDAESARTVLNQLLKLLNRRQEYVEGGEAQNLQHIVVIVDTKDLSLYEHPVFTAMLDHHAQTAFSVVFMQTSINNVPDKCSAIIRLDIPKLGIWYGETGVGGRRVPAVGWDIEDTTPMGSERKSLLDPRSLANLPKRDLTSPLPTASLSDPAWFEILKFLPEAIQSDRCSLEDARQFAEQHLAHVRLKTGSSDSDIPNRLGFMEMYKASEISAIDLESRWKRRPSDGKLPFFAPIGVTKKTSGTNNDKQKWDLLNFHLLEGMDGPHGLVAGTTGSGKSELLQTIVSSLAIEHHPHFLSFFLIDYKGGSTFNVFRKLPHTLGNVSDLDATEAERALSALKSEIKYRKRVFASITEEKINDIIKYHELYVNYLNYRDGIQLPKEVRSVPERMVPIPHLVIIIDEFAELKQELEHFMPEMARIARVGRSLGIHLILATQRPAGAVSEEVRSNSQFAICLRVRSVADSRDMIRESSATYLPSDIPGRGYIQRGSDPPRLFQTAYVGGRYRPSSEPSRYADRSAASSLVIHWASVQSDKPTGKFEYMPKQYTQLTTFIDDSAPTVVAKADDSWGTVVERLVDHIANYTETLVTLDQYEQLPELFLARLSTDLTLNDVLARREVLRLRRLIDIGMAKIATPEQREEEKHARLRIDQLYKQSKQEGEPDQYKWEWMLDLWSDGSQRMEMVVGLLDDPTNRRQDSLSINLAHQQERGHLVVYGAPSTGKTTLLRTIVASLAQYHAPWEYQVYIIDMGNKGLQALEAFPHVGTYALGSDEAKIRRMLRWLAQEFRKRRDEIGRADIFQSNREAVRDKRYHDIKPILMLVVDNFSELWDMFGQGTEPETELLVQIAQDGINLGLVLLASGGNSFRDVPSSIVRSVSYRIAFEMTEIDQMQMVVGGRPPYLGNEPPAGRGMWRGSPPLQVQVAMMGSGTNEQIADEITKFGQELYAAASKHEAWDVAPHPHQIGELPSYLDMSSPVISEFAPDSAQAGLALPIGQSFDDLSVYAAMFNETSGHLFAIGRRASGKSALLQTVVLTAANLYEPEALRIVLVCPDAKSAARFDALKRLPHVKEQAVVSNITALAELLADLHKLFDESVQSDQPLNQRILVVIDETHTLFNDATDKFIKVLQPSSMVRKDEDKTPHTMQQQAAFFEDDWAARGATYGLHFAVSYEHRATTGTSPKFVVPFLNTLKQNSTTCITSHKNAEVLGVKDYKRVSRRVRFEGEAGRGFVFVEGDEPQVVQFVAPLPENHPESELYALVEKIRTRPHYHQLRSENE